MRRTAVPVIVAFLVLAAACSDGASTAESPTTVITAPGNETLPTSTTTTALSTTTTTAMTGPVYGGRVVIGIERLEALNPLTAGDFTTWQIAQAIHASVFDIDASTQELIPELVTDLPTVDNGGVVVNEDGTMTVRYEIRPEAVWADGVPVSGDDFVFTVNVLLDHAADVWPSRLPLLNLVDRDSIVAGPKSFEVTFTEPTLEFEMMLSTIVPRHQVEGTDFLADWNDVPWVSAGPFVFDSLDRDAGVLTLVRNQRYWKTSDEGEPLPYIDQLEFHAIWETETLHRRFRDGDLDVIQPVPWREEIDRIVSAGATIDAAAGPIWEHFNFNFGVNNRNPLSLNRHLKFRQAVAHAIDRKWLAYEWYGGYSEGLDSIWGVFSPHVSTDGWAQYDYDPNRSRQLLAELCAELSRDCDADPLEVLFSTTSNADMRPWMTDRFEEMLADVGILFQQDLEDSQRFFGATIDKGDWDTGMWAWVGSPGLVSMVSFLDIMDPDSPPPDGQNYYRWGTPAVTDAALSDVFYSVDEPQLDPNQGPSTLIDEHSERFAEIVDLVRTTVDEAEIRALLREAEQILADQVVIIPLFSRIDAVAFWPQRVVGVEHNASSAGFTWNVEHWYQPGG